MCIRHHKKFGMNRLSLHDEDVFCCHDCLLEDYWRENNWEFEYCSLHKMSGLLKWGGCRKCKYVDQEPSPSREELKLIAIQGEQSRNRITLYYDSKTQSERHRNETCSSCDKAIDFEEWFCYCSLCPDCYLNSDEEVDNYLGIKDTGDGL